MKTKTEERVKEIIKDYILNDYPLCLLFMQNYPAIEAYGKENTEILWAEMKEELEGECYESWR